MSIQFVGDHAVPPEVTRVAAESGVGDVRAVFRVPHQVATENEVGKAKRTDLRNGFLILGAMATPLLTVLLLWWLTGSIGAGIGAGAALAVVGAGVWYFVENKDTGGPKDRDQVYVCGDGFVLPAEDEVPPRAFRWTDFVAIHRSATNNYVNGQHIFTAYSFRLMLPDGTRVVFHGVELPKKPSQTEILELGPVLEEEMTTWLLPLAVEALNAGRVIEFGPLLAISAQGIGTAKGHLPWSGVGELSVGAGNLVLGAAGSKPAQYPLGDIANFQVFWTLAQNLRAHHTG